MRGLVVVVLPAPAGCGPDDAERCLPPPRTLAAEERLRMCERAFQRTGRPEIGIQAAQAHYELGHDDDVLRLVHVLENGPKAGSAHHLAGRVWLSRGDEARRVAELELALRRHREVGEDGGGPRGDPQLTPTPPRAAPPP